MTTLNYERRGIGTPIVLLHGIGSHWQVWSPVIDQLAADHDVIAVDLPGYGDSVPLPPGTQPGINSIADALEHFLDAIDVPAAHLVGNSLGGWLALELAKRDRALSVTALSPGGFADAREAAYVRQSLKLSVRLVRGLGVFGDRIVATGVGRTLLLSQLVAKPRKMPATAAASSLRALASAPSFDNDLASISHDRFSGGEQILAPVTIAWGQRDRLLFPRQGRRAVQEIPGATGVTLRGCGHVPTFDDPKQVTSVILSTIASSTGEQLPRAHTKEDPELQPCDNHGFHTN
ncbi:alpha/beta fold hydrolase [Rhodococcus sp. H29-C3]|uniref:alpha/beta fold hydrolase n=1 Tax=Rhodococcus sp. H29-C3 TaxID=3046307 RepID=UPI0024B8F8E1|nr:alpha/beta fold hydrolase [Rhodococcus sp. H29-C3]MDJ0359040.1 alpha/beta fold hydrolase [Rhodococcus sp. H29-C3]